MIVHQILSGAGPRDAITAEARAFRERFSRWGWAGEDVAARIAPGLEGGFAPLDTLHPAPEDLLLLHHSAATPGLSELLARPNPKLLLYHNVTPARWLWAESPVVAAHCAQGRVQLRELVAATHVAAADSAFNAAELAALGARRTEVIPLLVDLERLGAPAPRRPPRPDAPQLIFVGRLSPHKRQDRLIQTLALLRRVRAPGARLTLVGEPLTEAYAQSLRALGDRLAPGAVTVESGLSAAELGERYRAADVFVCLSEHEGFCIPLLEAMHFGLPIVARAAGAVPEVAGDAALLFAEDDPALICELIWLALGDPELGDELDRRGRLRLLEFAPARVEAQLRAAVLAAGNGAGGA